MSRDTFKGHTDSISSVVFSSDGNTIASVSTDSTVSLWDRETGEDKLICRPLVEGYAGNIVSVAFSPDGNTIASRCKYGTIRLWDVATGEAKLGSKTLDGSYGFAFLLDGKTLAFFSNSILRLWDTQTGDDK